MSERNASIDIAKGLGIILVVLGHNWIIAHEHGESFRIIFSFHMPLFFFLSGAVLHQDISFKNFLVFKADALLKPFFVVLTAWGLARILVSGIDASSYFRGMLYATGNSIEWVPLWYLPHLFLAMLLAWLILRLIRRQQSVTWLLCLVIVGLLAAGVFCMHVLSQAQLSSHMPSLAGLNQLTGRQQDSFPGLPWSLDLIGISTAYILLGYVLHEYVMRFKFQTWVFALALLLFAALHFFYDETIDLNMRLYGNVWISTAQALLGIYLVLSISTCMQKHTRLRAVFVYLGSSSLFIMIFHSWIEWKIFSLLSRYSSLAYLNASLALLAGIVLPLVLLEIVKRQKIMNILLLPRPHISHVQEAKLKLDGVQT